MTIISTSGGDTGWLPWDPVLTGFATNPADCVYLYRVVGDECELQIFQATDGISNAAGFTISLPRTAANLPGQVWQAPCRVRNNGNYVSAPGLATVLPGATVLDVTINYGVTAWGVINGKRVESVRLKYRV